MMRLVRHDVIIHPQKDGNILVQHPSTHRQFTFSQDEAFLINELKKPYNIGVLLVKLNAKFNQKKTAGYIKDFVDRLEKLDLLEDRNQENSRTKEAIQTPSHGGKEQNRKRLNHWSFFSPQNTLDLIVNSIGFLRYFNSILLILSGLAFVTLFFNISLYQHDIGNVTEKMPWLKHLTFTLFTVNLYAQILKGCVARYFSLKTPSFGILLAYGVIPRFDIVVNLTSETSTKVKLWLTASGILARLHLFSVGVMVWILTRETGTNLTFFGAALALYSLFSILFNVNPLISGDGYRFITLYYGIPNIRERAVRCIKNQLFSTPEVIARHTEDRIALKIYGLMSLLFILLAILYVGYFLGHWFEENYQGLGVVALIVIIVYLVLRFRYLSQVKKEISAGHYSSEHNEIKETVIHPSVNKSKTFDGGSLRNIPWIRIFFLGFFIVSFFLPYQYEAGGVAVIVPIHHQKIYSENKGIIKKVYFNGSEWLEKDTVLAEMENYLQQKDVLLMRQNIAKTEQELEILLTTPSVEEIEFASEQLITSKLIFANTLDDYKKLETLYNAGAVSYEEYLDGRKQMDLEQQNIQEKKANLRVVENQVNPHKIESTKIELKILKENLKFYEEKLERTKLRMPRDGKIITMNLKNLEKKFLDEGEFFAEIEDTNHVQIEIQLPEMDIGQVSIGNSITFKFKALLNQEKIIKGRVTSIYPVVASTVLGNMLTVVSIVPNEDFALKTGMTGYAKVEGEKMMAIEAFTKSLVSFFQIELWSWLP